MNVKLGIGVGLGVGGCILAVAIVCYLLRWYRSRVDIRGQARNAPVDSGCMPIIQTTKDNNGERNRASPKEDGFNIDGGIIPKPNELRGEEAAQELDAEMRG